MYSSISENLKAIKFNISEAKAKYRSDDDVIRLMAVTKTVPYDKVNFVISSGVCLLGENRVQEFLDKKEFYDKSAEINFIGHLQTNKVKYIIDSVNLMHSVDNLKLAAEINRLSVNSDKIMDILIEVNIGNEDSKSGVHPDKLEWLLREISVLPNLRIKGLMTIPPIENTEYYFDKMNGIFTDLKTQKIENVSMDILSMGMSNDYVLAVKHGSNIVRIGSGIFGARK